MIRSCMVISSSETVNYSYNLSFHLAPCENVSLDTADAQSDQSLSCPLTESFDIIECINGEQIPG